MTRSEHGGVGAAGPVRRRGFSAAPAGARPTRILTHRLRGWWPFAVPLVVLVFGLLIRLEASSPPYQTPDERFYTFCANGLCESGSRFMPGFIQVCWDHRDQPEYPWPSRIGYFWLVAGAMHILGDSTVNAGATLSMWASLGVLILTAWLALQRLGPWTTAIALLFLATSPLDLAIANRTWQDEVVAMLALLMVNAYVRQVERPTRPAWAIAFFAVAALALTVKESEAVVFVLGTLGMTVAAWRSRGGPRAAAFVLAGGVAAAAAATAFVVVSSGGIEPLRKSLELWKAASVPNDYMRKYQMGSPAYYAVGLGILNAVPFTLGLAGAIALVLRAPFMRAPWMGPGGRALLEALAGFVLLFGAIACAHSQKNMRFLSILFVPVFVLASAFTVAALEALRTRQHRLMFRGAVTVVVIGLCAQSGADLARYRHWFIDKAVTDLATPWFTR